MYQAFKRVRNKAREFYPHQIILRTIADLNHPEAHTVERLRIYRPWELLLLAKWTFQFGDYTDPDRHNLEEKHYSQLINLMQEMGQFVRMPSDNPSLLMWMRKMAFQQFWFQERIRSQQIAQQSLLFNRLPDNHSFQTDFCQHTGISIHDFVILAIAVLVAFAGDHRQQFITLKWFHILDGAVASDAVPAFLRIISKPFEDIREYLTSSETSPSSKEYEYYEQSPFKKFPLLQIEDRYYCMSPILLFHSLHSFVHDTLKGIDPNAFVNKFGGTFEKYIGDSLGYSGVAHITEDDLRVSLKTKHKLVDFMLYDSGVNVLIDAKGVELPTLGMLTHLQDVLRDKTKSSILKAITQAYETWNSAQSLSSISNLPVGTNPPFLVVVTLKELYLGTGADFLREVADDFYSNLLARFERKALIPPEHIYFLSLSAFEYLIQAIKSGHSLVAILNEAVRLDRDNSTKSFLFDQHVYKFKTGIPDYLDAEFAAIMRELKTHFPESSSEVASA